MNSKKKSKIFQSTKNEIDDKFTFQEMDEETNAFDQNMEISDNPSPSSPSIKDFSFFFKFKSFNSFQKEHFTKVFESNENVLISGPFKTGKSVFLELALIKNFRGNILFDSKHRTALYISPFEEISDQIISKWKPKYEYIWSDFQIEKLKFDDAQPVISGRFSSFSGLVVATPEKLNMLINNWKMNINFFSNLSLILVDKLHLMNHLGNGDFECFLTKLKWISSLSIFKNENLPATRFVASSAAFSNIHEIAKWIRVEPSLCLTSCASVKSEPQQMVFSFKYCTDNYFLFQRSLSFKLHEIISLYTQNKATLIIVPDNYSARESTSAILNSIETPNQSFSVERHEEYLQILKSEIKDEELKKGFSYGIGFLHDGLCVEDQKLIEREFKSKRIRILVIADMLGYKIDLKAPCVIVKGCKRYHRGLGKYCDFTQEEWVYTFDRINRGGFLNPGKLIILEEKFKQNQFTNINERLQQFSYKSSILKNIKKLILFAIGSFPSHLYLDLMSLFESNKIEIQDSVQEDYICTDDRK